MTSTLIFGQAKQDKYGNEIFEGGFTSPSPTLPPNPSRPEPVLLLLKLDNRDVMTGNECVREQTIKMGFEYLVICNRRTTFMNRVWVYFYNFGTNFELTFRNGFGWKSRLNEKIIECRRNSGDFVW
ncbi:MAG: hypothetical protein SFY32_02790 [Bacteroidota bacterium]|nr:hypothetical protein [Bacteroidota bacterium]